MGSFILTVREKEAIEAGTWLPNADNVNIDMCKVDYLTLQYLQTIDLKKTEQPLVLAMHVIKHALEIKGDDNDNSCTRQCFNELVVDPALNDWCNEKDTIVEGKEGSTEFVIYKAAGGKAVVRVEDTDSGEMLMDGQVFDNAKDAIVTMFALLGIIPPESVQGVEVIGDGSSDLE